MELVKHQVEIKSAADIITLFAFGDLHIANQAFDVGSFKKLIHKIQETPNAIWIGMGDFGECISPKDKRFDQETLRPRYRDKLHRLPQEEAKELKELLHPIKSSCIGILYGNHEDRLRQMFGGYDLIWELCEYFGWKNLSSEALIRLLIKRCREVTKVDIFAAHGYGNARKWGGRINKISDVALGIRADIYLMGHQHSAGVIKEIELSLPAKGKLILLQKERIGYLVPSFYRTYQEKIDTYASKRLFPPSAIGWAEIKIKVERPTWNNATFSLRALI